MQYMNYLKEATDQRKKYEETLHRLFYFKNFDRF